MHYLLKGVLSCTLLFCLFFISCNFKPIHYPYAENNTTVNEYYDIQVADDYEWLESATVSSPIKSKWLKDQVDLCESYFSDRDTCVRKRIDELASIPHYRFIDLINDTLYYYRARPYSKEINLFKYIEDIQGSHFITSIEVPFVLTDKTFVRLSPDLRFLACIGKVYGSYYSLYIYDLQSEKSPSHHIIKGVADFPFFWNDKGVIYMEDPLASSNELNGINKISIYNPIASESSVLFEDSIDEIATLIDFNFDQKSNSLYLGKYTLNNQKVFQLQRFCMDRQISEILLEMPMKGNVDYRIGGVDKDNAYIIGIDEQRRGEVLGYNIEDNEIDTLLERHWMPITGFSQQKDHILAYFQDFNENRAYVINKRTRKIQEMQLDDKKFYTFLMNKNSHSILYQEESHISPKDLYKVSPSSLNSPMLLGTVDNLPFNPDDYQMEYKTVRGKDGNDINLTVTYKRGIKRDGSNPVLLMSFINAENSYLDQFDFARILYMDYGYVFVKRSFADSHKSISLQQRVDDLEAVIYSLIDEAYSSPDKIAVLGKEYGAAALMCLLNKNPELKIHTLMLDGLYDLVRYQHAGKLKYYDKFLFNIDSQADFMALLKESPYHNVKYRESYPPILMMVSLENSKIPPVHTFKMTALMQMRTKGLNPIILFAPINDPDQNYVYDFKDYIEHAFCFLMKNMDVAMIN